MPCTTRSSEHSTLRLWCIKLALVRERLWVLDLWEFQCTGRHNLLQVILWSGVVQDKLPAGRHLVRLLFPCWKHPFCVAVLGVPLHLNSLCCFVPPVVPVTSPSCSASGKYGEGSLMFLTPETQVQSTPHSHSQKQSLWMVAKIAADYRAKNSEEKRCAQTQKWHDSENLHEKSF